MTVLALDLNAYAPIALLIVMAISSNNPFEELRIVALSKSKWMPWVT